MGCRNLSLLLAIMGMIASKPHGPCMYGVLVNPYNRLQEQTHLHIYTSKP